MKTWRAAAVAALVGMLLLSSGRDRRCPRPPVTAHREVPMAIDKPRTSRRSGTDHTWGTWAPCMFQYTTRSQR